MQESIFLQKTAWITLIFYVTNHTKHLRYIMCYLRKLVKNHFLLWYTIGLYIKLYCVVWWLYNSKAKLMAAQKSMNEAFFLELHRKSCRSNRIYIINISPDDIKCFIIHARYMNLLYLLNISSTACNSKLLNTMSRISFCVLHQIIN